MHANSLYIKVQNCTANASRFFFFKWDFHRSKCIKIFWRQPLANKKGAADEVLEPNAQETGEVYIHTYRFSGETEVAGDLGFE